jgi:hypothetical protein
VDQYVIHHPEFVLGGRPEEARLDPDNLHVLLAHLRAATFELPFEPGEWFGPGPADDLLAFLGESGHVRQADDTRWYWSSENFPASEISMRAAAPENVVIIDTTPDRPRVLGEVDLFSAQVLVHQHAIYMHESVQYHVDRLEWVERKAYVHRIDADHYTYANRAVTLKPLDVFATAPSTGGSRVHGEVMVASLVTLYKKLKFITDENVGWGPVDLPEIELQTTAYWLTAEQAAAGWRRDELDVALIGAGRAIQAVAAVLLMVDPRDLGLVSQVRSPAQRRAHGLPLRGDTGRGGPLRATVGAARGAGRGGPRAHRGVCVRGGLPGVHRPATGAGRGWQGARPAPPGVAWGGGHGPGRMTADRAPGAHALPAPPALPGIPERAHAVVGRDRRLANLRATLARPGGPPVGPDQPPARSPFAGRRNHELADRLAMALAADVVLDPAGTLVVRRLPDEAIPLDRKRLASLPGHPPADAPLVCLDTETTGLATAAGTLAFLVGLARWRGDTFEETQLLLPDHADEAALLTALERWITPDAWLVTYNGRGFDWPLLEARFRMHGRPAPPHAGHLDLLPFVRRVFRHRMDDARLRTVEGTLLGIVRHGDVGGWEIPGIYLDVLRGGPVEPLAAVVRHNELDVRSLGHLLAHVDSRYADRTARHAAPRGDLAGLARAYGRERRHEAALDCLDDAFAAADPARDPFGRSGKPPADGDEATRSPWWAPRTRPDFGGQPPRSGWRGPLAAGRGGPLGPGLGPGTWEASGAWTDERLAAERARVLRRLGRWTEAAEAWQAATPAAGAPGAIAWIEVAKLREHRLDDPAGALAATRAAWRAVERSRGLGRPLPRLEADLGRRARRLVDRLRRQEARVRRSA